MDGGEETGARVRQIAGDVLGLADLRPAQMEAAAALAAGRDCLAVLPSGAGKSAIYQIAGGLLTAGDHSDGCHAAVRSAHVGHQARQADRAHRTQAQASST
jgi:ATP-dependent DNA helicase RecQ